MSLSPESIGQLQAYGQLAVAFAGFAGVIGAFSRFRMNPEATAFRIRSMVTFALAEVVLTLVPPLIASFGVSELVAWRISAGVGGVASSVLLAILARRARALYLLGHLKRKAAYVLCGVTVMVIAPLYLAAFGVGGLNARTTLFALFFLGIVLCTYHFVMLITAVSLHESEQDASGERR